jgi:type I restriction enzyme S subunit
MTQTIMSRQLGELTSSGEMPEGWVESVLPQIADITMGQSPPGSSYNEEGKGLPFFQGKTDFGDRHPTVRVWCTQPTKIAKPGDVLITVRAPVGPTNVADRRCGIGRGLAAFTPLGGIATEFLLFALRLKEPELAVSGTGSTFTAISKKDIENIAIRVPPLQEQVQIVRRVEELLAHLNGARDHLFRVPAILKRFRQAVLGAACSGKLTADWREKQLNVEHADQLVARISKKRSTTDETKTIREVDAQSLPTLPDGWTWVYLADFGYMSRGRSRHRPRDAEHLYNGPYPFIQTGDIAQSGGRITSHHQTYSEAGLQQSHLWPAGTVCITIAANIAHSAILSYPACFPDSVVGVIPDADFCVKEYLEFFVRTARADLEQYAPATAQKNINIGILNDVAVPIPPFREQQEIVRRTEALLDRADVIQERLVKATVVTERITQSILARAFRGELVPTEAELARREGREYEPASVLLERISKQRESKASSNPERRRTRTKVGLSIAKGQI